jgi:hypothetical protein
LNTSRALGPLTPRPNARDQDVDQTFGGPLTVGSQAYVRNPGKRAQWIERVKVQTNVAARDRAIDQLRHCLLHLCRQRRLDRTSRQQSN